MKTQLQFVCLFCISILFLVIACDKDECEDVICLNGGVCVNGQCDCPDGYEGPSCGDQETPIRMRILSVEVIRFPAFDQGTNWDIGDGPDIFFQVLEGSTLIYDSPTFFEDADPTNGYLFDAILVDLNNPTASHTIQLMDYDDGITADDWMGGITFVPYFSNTNGFPTTIDLDAGGNVGFRLGVSYVW